MSATTVDGLTVSARGLAAATRRGPIFGPVDLDADPGSVTVVCGSGGCGRSTLLLSLAGRFAFSTGEVRIGGRSSRDGLRPLRDLVAVARVRPGIEPDGGLPVTLVHRQAVWAGRGRVTPASIDAGCALVGAPAATGAPIGDLHPVDRLLHVLAIASAQRTPVIVADDVDSGLGAQDRLRAWAAVARLAQAGHTVLATATDPPLAIDHTTLPLAHPSERAWPKRPRRGGS